MAKQKTKPESVLIELPLSADVEPTTWGLHIDARLTPQQSLAIRRIANALDKQQAKLASGRRVISPGDALKYLLEQVEAAAA